MARTKAEIRAWLEGRIGGQVADKSNAELNGQCVAMIKGLMEFLGVPNPYAARGHAKDAGDNYIAQGIGTPGRGWLTICVNRNMGGGYGHIWADLLDEANYEQNGGIALRVTKNTRPINQAQQFINFDKWITDQGGGGAMIIQNAENWYGRCNDTHWRIRGRELARGTFKAFVGKDFLHFVEACSDDPEAQRVQEWQNVGRIAVTDRWQQQIYDLQAQVAALGKRPTQAQLAEADKKAAELAVAMEKARKEAEAVAQKLAAMEKQHIAAKEEADNFLTALINAIRNLFK